MSELGMIYAYRQLTPFTTQGSGTAQWCQGERDGNLYFIKEFLSPTLPPIPRKESSHVCIQFSIPGLHSWISGWSASLD